MDNQSVPLSGAGKHVRFRHDLPCLVYGAESRF